MADVGDSPPQRFLSAYSSQVSAIINSFVDIFDEI